VRLEGLGKLRKSTSSRNITGIVKIRRLKVGWIYMGKPEMNIKLAEHFTERHHFPYHKKLILKRVSRK
jgi:hypothetical protein